MTRAASDIVKFSVVQVCGSTLGFLFAKIITATAEVNCGLGDRLETGEHRSGGPADGDHWRRESRIWTWMFQDLQGSGMGTDSDQRAGRIRIVDARASPWPGRRPGRLPSSPRIDQTQLSNHKSQEVAAWRIEDAP